MTTTQKDIPRFYGIRVSLLNVVRMFEAIMPNYQCVDIPETLRIMLADYFYGDVVGTAYQHIREFDRTLVFGFNLIPPMEFHGEMIEMLGDIFWNLEETIRRNVLLVKEDYNSAYEYRPHECFYVFDTSTYDLMVYIPERKEFTIQGATALDGRAVIATCRSTWPSYLTNGLLERPATGENY